MENKDSLAPIVVFAFNRLEPLKACVSALLANTDAADSDLIVFVEKDKDEAYQQADIFVFPTYNECFGLVLLEAMQYGLPCISTNEGAISDIVDDGVTGYIVEAHNVGHLAAKIEELIDGQAEADGYGNEWLSKVSGTVYARYVCEADERSAGAADVSDGVEE